MESASVNSDNNPCIWEQDVWLLEGFDIFVPGVSSLVMYEAGRRGRVGYFEFAIFTVM